MAIPAVSITRKGSLVFNASAARDLFPQDFETKSVRIFVEVAVVDRDLVFAVRTSGSRYHPKESTMTVDGTRVPSYVRTIYLRQATMTAAGERKRPAGGWADISPILAKAGIAGTEIPYRPYVRGKTQCVLSLSRKEQPCPSS